MSECAHKEKVCQEEICSDQWEALPLEVIKNAGSFIYCPFCANEMVTRCSACGEAVHDFSFNFCPWCGTCFEDEDPGQS
jgi:predicted RNA-binding Zn-ribbon protein involved in translation (DUF1610 family)